MSGRAARSRSTTTCPEIPAAPTLISTHRDPVPPTSPLHFKGSDHSTGRTLSRRTRKTALARHCCGGNFLLLPTLQHLDMRPCRALGPLLEFPARLRHSHDRWFLDRIARNPAFEAIRTSNSSPAIIASTRTTRSVVSATRPQSRIDFATRSWPRSGEPAVRLLKTGIRDSRLEEAGSSAVRTDQRAAAQSAMCKRVRVTNPQSQIPNLSSNPESRIPNPGPNQ